MGGAGRGYLWGLSGGIDWILGWLLGDGVLVSVVVAALVGCGGGEETREDWRGECGSTDWVQGTGMW